MKTAERFTRLQNDLGKGKAAVEQNEVEQENPVFCKLTDFPWQQTGM